MATNAHTDGDVEFGDLDPAPEPEEDGDQWLDLEPGDSVVGEITGFRPTAGRNGIIEIDGKAHRLNATMRQQICEALVVGERMGLSKSEEESSFENDDGETVTYHEREVGF